ncbi:MAG: hypothetical protein KC613_10310 [Myxococcales bacterium]|nr:hypothetical protein [Myxococcales bacterium]
MVEHIDLRGVAFSRRPGLRAQLGIAAGDPLDEAAVQDGRVALLATGLFEQVQVRLAKGKARGHVKVIYDCTERVTTSIEGMHLGHARPTNLWGGIQLADLDPFGLGLAVDGGFVASGSQGAVQLGAGPRDLFGTDLRLHVQAHALFGDEPFVGPRGQGTTADGALDQVPGAYRRLGLEASLTAPIGATARLHFGLRGERVDHDLPEDAWQVDPDGVQRPFQFDLNEGWLGAASLGVEFDTRNDPAFPSRGVRASLHGRAGWLGGPFAAVLTGFENYFRLPFGHVVQLNLRAGAVFGDAPFFERWFIGDLHPYVPERSLGLNFARRRGPNLLDGPIREQRYETVAGRLGMEYRIPLKQRTAADPYAVELFVGTALVSLGTPGERGGADALDPGTPLDLAVDAGLRIESKIGVMGLSLGNLFLVVDP